MNTFSRTIASLLLSLAVCFPALSGEIQKIWPEKKMPHPQSHQIAAMTDEVSLQGFKPEKHRCS